MTTLLQIKPYIFNFVSENLDSSFANKVYWLGERINIPSYPYCLLNVIAESKNKRTSRHNGEFVEILESGELEPTVLRQNITTRYKTCTITVGVYNYWTIESEFDMDVAKEFTYQQIDNLEGAFEDYPVGNLFSVQNISSIRPLHETTEGGFMYRYEFDLTIGYNEERITNKEYGKSVDANIKNANTDDRIKFKVTISNNDNINIETTI